jgi:hypothetical protein
MRLAQPCMITRNHTNRMRQSIIRSRWTLSLQSVLTNTHYFIAVCFLLDDTEITCPYAVVVMN